MTLYQHLRRRTIFERTFHAVSYEVVAVLISSPALAWIMDRPLFQMGSMAILVSCIAMMWNVVFNFLFDFAQSCWGFSRTLPVRVLHGIGFEVGLVFFSVPAVAWWLNTRFLTALYIEAGMLAFFFPYTIVFNWCYDILRLSAVKYLLMKQWRQRNLPTGR